MAAHDERGDGADDGRVSQRSPGAAVTRLRRPRAAIILPRPLPLTPIMRIRLISIVLPALSLTSVVSLAAQGRGGRGGADTRPEVTFPVDLPTDDAKLA